MSNRIAKAFEGKKPYIGYLTGGDGGIDYTVECAIALIAGGVDILEIGLPFSDPVADGPVIQKAHERALEEGATSATLLAIARRLRAVSEVPLVLFSYFNPILQKGEQYLKELKEAGFDAVLIVDLSIRADHPEPFFQALEQAKLLPILLATPSTDEKRLKQISKVAKGFLYYVAQKGTTGVRSQLAVDFSTQLRRLRTYFQIPIVAGFGIADQITAKGALEYADGFVVGSAIVNQMERKLGSEELKKFAESIDPRGRK